MKERKFTPKKDKSTKTFLFVYNDMKKKQTTHAFNFQNRDSLD